MAMQSSSRLINSAKKFLLSVPHMPPLYSALVIQYWGKDTGVEALNIPRKDGQYCPRSGRNVMKSQQGRNNTIKRKRSCFWRKVKNRTKWGHTFSSTRESSLIYKEHRKRFVNLGVRTMTNREDVQLILMFSFDLSRTYGWPLRRLKTT